MGGLSIWHWLVVLAVVLLLFGGNKVSALMGDVALGLKAFKKNIADEPHAELPAATGILVGPIAVHASGHDPVL